MYIDTHAHLYLPEFQPDLDEVINTAKHHGVEAFVLPNVDRDSIQPLLEVAQKYPCCYPTMGLHPTSVKSDFKEILEEIVGWFDRVKFNAVGEVGIDLYWDKTFLKQQQEVFSAQLDLAAQLNLPVIIHSRDAFPEIFDVMDAYRGKGLSGVFHSFSGGVEEVDWIRKFQGFSFGIGGVLTFKNSNLKEVVRHIPIELTMLETDAPYLAPVPHRGKRNSPLYIPIIAEALAIYKAITVDVVAEATTQNAKNMFNLS